MTEELEQVYTRKYRDKSRAKMRGMPIGLNIYEPREVITNKYFQRFKMPEFEKIYLPNSMTPFVESEPLGAKKFLVDDNRSVVDSEPYMQIDGMDFYLSVKGIGSTTSPFSRQLLSKAEVCNLLTSQETKEKIVSLKETQQRYLTGELWSRGSPYGAQGLDYASIALRASEMADVTSIHGFRIAPLVKINFFPESFQSAIKQVYWYRRFDKQMVQEARLVPSNIRIYFHSDFTIGDDIGELFNHFGLDTNEKCMKFLINFVRSGMSILTLLARSLKNNGDGSYSGLDFYDVWLDKDAVVAQDGTIFWVDGEGLEWITLWGSNRAELEHNIDEKFEYQIYRSLYEFMYAYEQIRREKNKRFSPELHDRKSELAYILTEALRKDEVIQLDRSTKKLEIVIDPIVSEENLVKRFTMIDW